MIKEVTRMERSLRLVRAFRLGFSFTLWIHLSVLQAQSPLSRIVGTVRDPTGASVASATVTGRLDSRGLTRSVQSDAEGNFTLDLLPEGTYSLTCEMAGFKKAFIANIPLTSRQVMRIDLALEVGDAATTVDVSETAPVVSSETATVQETVMTRRFVDKEQGHRYYGFLFASQFVPYGGYSSVLTSYRGPGTTSNQLRSRMEGLEVDNQHPPTPPDYVSEIKVGYSGMKAESQSPLLMDVSTRNGSNQFHGLFEVQGQNPAMNSLGPNPNARRAGGQTTNLRWYGRLAGPVLIPKIYNGKNRTFFWFGFTRFALRDLGQTRGSYYIAAPAWRGGDFSQVPTNFFTNSSRTLFDPATGQPFPGGTVPASRVNAVSGNIQALNPAPNLVNLSDPAFTGLNWRNQSAGKLYGRSSLNIRNFRFDHQLTSKDSLFYSYNRIVINNLNDATEGFNIWQEISRNPTRNHVLSWTRVVSPTMLNELRVGLARGESEFGPIPTDASTLGYEPRFGNGLEALRDLGFTWTPGGFNPDSRLGNALPVVCVAGVYSPLCGFSRGRQRVNLGLLDNRHLIDNFSIHRRSHSIKMGIDVVRLLDAGYGGNPFGDFYFDGRFTGLPYADFLLGLPGTSGRSGILPRPYRQGGWYAGYVQDDWKLHPNLTVELGVRFEYFPVVREKNGLMVNFDPKTASLVVPNEQSLRQISPAFPVNQLTVLTTAQAGFPEWLRNYPQPLFYPRAGFAWRPFSHARTAVRGGVGQFSSAPTLRQSMVSNSPFVLDETFDNVFTNGQPAFSFPNPFPTGTGRIPAQSAFGVTPDFPVPYSYNWNLSVEQELLPNMGLRLSYMGAKVTQLGYRRNINKPAPGLLPYRSDCASQPSGSCVGPRYQNFSSVTLAEAGANSIANVFQIELRKRWSHGLEFSVDYSMNRTLTDAQDTGDNRGGSDYGSLIEDPDNRRRDRGVHGRTVPHRLVAMHVWELPFGRGHQWLNRSRLLDAFAGGWTVVGQWSYSSRVWLTPIWSGSDFSNTGTFAARPDLVAGCDPSVDNPSASRIFNPGCFAIPSPGRYGSAGRSLFPGLPFSTSVWSDSVLNFFKTFQLTDRYAEQGVRLRVGAYFVNFANHPYLSGAFPTGYGDANNVTINSPNADRGTYVGNRTVQISARLEF